MNIPRPESVPELHADSWDRLSTFAARTGRTLEKELGWGNEGLIYSTTAKTAIKSYRYHSRYENERNVYTRLLEKDVESVGNFAIPILRGYDDELWIVEMSVVSPPFILDFAGAYLDKKPPFDAEQWEEWEKEKIEQFEGRWPEVRRAMATFRRHGIHLNDVKPGNVEFGD